GGRLLDGVHGKEADGVGHTVMLVARGHGFSVCRSEAGSLRGDIAGVGPESTKPSRRRPLQRPPDGYAGQRTVNNLADGGPRPCRRQSFATILELGVYGGQRGELC